MKRNREHRRVTDLEKKRDGMGRLESVLQRLNMRCPRDIQMETSGRASGME